MTERESLKTWVAASPSKGCTLSPIPVAAGVTVHWMPCWRSWPSTTSHPKRSKRLRSTPLAVRYGSTTPLLPRPWKAPNTASRFPWRWRPCSVDRRSSPCRPECLGRPELISFARKVELHVDPELDRAFPARVPARVIVRTARGDYEKLVTDALGDPANPLDAASLESKFRTLSRGIMPPQAQDEMIAAIARLDTGGYSRFIELLRRPGTPRSG